MKRFGGNNAQVTGGKLGRVGNGVHRRDEVSQPGDPQPAFPDSGHVRRPGINGPDLDAPRAAEMSGIKAADSPTTQHSHPNHSTPHIAHPPPESPNRRS
ncbi:hypothetical protein Ato02nite_000770 [Paractinoplanes toevensis]|uniref:Uncharacterized protein n=1 Tax=Paractinoplanes toevensis TaxID=571911 RepID=A0A919T2R1_9ACTN|nr:hypothetical protein Ato02nite_000770 [Actinoplanes toevensis]